MTSVSGLDESEAAAVATEFGVATEQVRRDHFISLVLGALTVHSDELIFCPSAGSALPALQRHATGPTEGADRRVVRRLEDSNLA